MRLGGGAPRRMRGVRGSVPFLKMLMCGHVFPPHTGHAGMIMKEQRGPYRAVVGERSRLFWLQ